MHRAIAFLSLLAALGGCATAPLPADRDAAATRTEVTRGILHRSGQCVLVGENEAAVVPIWPRGTRITSDAIELAAANGGAHLRFGDVAYLFGRHVRDLARIPVEAASAVHAASECGQRAFLVGNAETQRQLDAAMPEAPYTSGLLVLRGDCLLIENIEGLLVPIWPAGTSVTDKIVVTPNLRGHAALPIGGRAGVKGRYVYADDGSLERAGGPAAAACARRGIVVEKANRVYLPNNAADFAAMSDAVVVAEVLGIDPSDPLGDGFLSTVVVRVVEPLTGRFRRGQVLRIRHVAGQDQAGGWHVATHDALYQPFGFLRVKAGERLLLFVNQDFYRQQAEARGGSPIEGYVGASEYRIADGRIMEGFEALLPDTVAELRAIIRKP